MDWSIWHKKIICEPFNRALKVNEACLKIISELNAPLDFYKRNVECYKCDFQPQERQISPHNTTSYIIDTKYGFESYFSNGNNTICQMKNYFQDFGVYLINVSQNSCSGIQVLREPEKFWINVTLMICLYMGLLGFFFLLRFIYKSNQFQFFSNVSLRELEMDLGSPNRNERHLQSQRQSRVKSIDAFRGLAIVVMIFVNYNGGDYSVFKHTPWNGLTIADLVFPWFIWIMGASIVLSLHSNLRALRSKKYIFFHILRRSAMLIVLGIALNSGNRNRNFLRICGVLQRVGVTYFIVASIELLFAKSQRNEQLRPWYYCLDITNSWIQWLIAFAFTMVHLLLTFLLEVPGCPTGYLGPGGFADHSKYRNCTGGAAGYIDRLVITDKHMYQRGSFVQIFDPPVAYDPEGLLGTLTSVLCAFFGVQAARIILTFENSYSRIGKWLAWAVVAGLTAGFLANWSQNDGIIPINKNLWSLSYVLACTSTAFFILALFYWLIDFTKIWSGFPLAYAGMNAIVLYLGHSLLRSQLPWRWIPFTNTHFELLVMDVSASTIWVAVSYFLYKRNIFLTL